MEERRQKILSARGVASRRAAEGCTQAGRLPANGVPAQLGQRADLDRDEVCLDGMRQGQKARGAETPGYPGAYRVYPPFPDACTALRFPENTLLWLS